MHTFSFDFRERWFRFGAWGMAFRVFTDENVYTPATDHCEERTTPDGWVVEAPTYAWAGGQRVRPGRFSARVRRVEDGIAWTVDVALPARVKGVAALVRGVAPGRVLDHRLTFVPFAAGENDLLQYPTSMPVPVFAVRHDADRCTVFESDDSQVRGKTLALSPQGEEFLVELHHHEDARFWSTQLSTPEWRMTRAADPSRALRRRMKLMERDWGLRPWEERSDVPDWARSICLVLNLHGMDWTGFLFNDYAKQLDAIRYVCERIPGRHVLAFLPGWDGRYNYNWPRYEPNELMGGEGGLRQLVAGAHDLGVHVIPQFGAASANRAFLPPGLHDCAFRDAFGNRFVKYLDWDKDRVPDTYRIMANVGHPAFRRFLLDKMIGLTERFGFDGVFLDINQTWHNDPSHSVMAGHRALATALHERFRDFLLFGEGWYDALLAAYPLVHQDHRAPLEHGEIFDRYARTTYHLQHPAPGSGSTGVYETGFAQPFIPDPERDVIPAIAFVNDTLTTHADEVDRRLDAAKAYGKRFGLDSRK